MSLLGSNSKSAGSTSSSRSSNRSCLIEMLRSTFMSLSISDCSRQRIYTDDCGVREWKVEINV